MTKMTKQYDNPQFELVSYNNRVFFSASGVVVTVPGGSRITQESVQPHVNIGG